MARTIVLRQIAYVNALRCQLRKQDRDAEVLRFVGLAEAEIALESYVRDLARPRVWA